MKMKVITASMPQAYIDGLDELVEAGMYGSRNQAIRIAVRDLLKDELWRGTHVNRNQE